MRSPLATMSTCLACLAWWAPAVEVTRPRNKHTR